MGELEGLGEEAKEVRGVGLSIGFGKRGKQLALLELETPSPWLNQALLIPVNIERNSSTCDYLWQ